MEIIKINCQTIGCNNKPKILQDNQYYGVFCEECLSRHSISYLQANSTK